VPASTVRNPGSFAATWQLRARGPTKGRLSRLPLAATAVNCPLSQLSAGAVTLCDSRRSSAAAAAVRGLADSRTPRATERDPKVGAGARERARGPDPDFGKSGTRAARGGKCSSLKAGWCSLSGSARVAWPAGPPQAAAFNFKLNGALSSVGQTASSRVLALQLRPGLRILLLSMRMIQASRRRRPGAGESESTMTCQWHFIEFHSP
jgi:hypothetical protein